MLEKVIMLLVVVLAISTSFGIYFIIDRIKYNKKMKRFHTCSNKNCYKELLDNNADTCLRCKEYKQRKTKKKEKRKCQPKKKNF